MNKVVSFPEVIGNIHIFALESMNKVGWKWLGYLVWAFHHQIALRCLRGLVQKRPKQTEEKLIIQAKQATAAQVSWKR